MPLRSTAVFDQLWKALSLGGEPQPNVKFAMPHGWHLISQIYRATYRIRTDDLLITSELL